MKNNQKKENNDNALKTVAILTLVKEVISLIKTIIDLFN